MNNTKKALILLTASALILLTSCGQTPEQKKKEAEEADKKVNVIGIMKSGDPSKCNELKDPIKVKNCVNNLYFDQGITKRDEKFCDKINDGTIKSRCKTQISYDKAVENSDKKICNNITKETLKNNCINNIILNKIFEEGKDDGCKEYIGNIQECKDSFNYTMASTKNDINLCNKIIDKKRKDGCISNIMMTSSQNGNQNQLPLNKSNSSQNNKIKK